MGCVASVATGQHGVYNDGGISVTESTNTGVVCVYDEQGKRAGFLPRDIRNVTRDTGSVTLHLTTRAHGVVLLTHSPERLQNVLSEYME